MARYPSKITEWPEDERPRERLLNLGPEKLINIGDIDHLNVVYATFLPGMQSI